MSEKDKKNPPKISDKEIKWSYTPPPPPPPKKPNTEKPKKPS